MQNGKEISVTPSYKPDANVRFRELGRMFDRMKKGWVFLDLVKEKLKDTLVKHCCKHNFTPARRGIVKIKAMHSIGMTHEPTRFGGRILVQAKDWDGGTRISDGVNLLSGALRS